MAKYVNISPIVADEEDEREAIYIKVKVDAEDALKGLKAIQREARKATQALRELEEAQQKAKQTDSEEDPAESDRHLRVRYYGELFCLTQQEGQPINFKFRPINEAIFRAVFWPQEDSSVVVDKMRGEGATVSIIAAARTAPDKVVVITEHEDLAKLLREEHGIEAYSLHDVDGRDFRGKVVIIDVEKNMNPPSRSMVDRLVRIYPCERLVCLRQKMHESREVFYKPEA